MQTILFTEYMQSILFTEYMQSILFTVYSGTLFAIIRIHWEAEATDYSGTLHQDSAMSGEDRPAVHHSRTASTQPSDVSWQPREGLVMLH